MAPMTATEIVRKHAHGLAATVDREQREIEAVLIHQAVDAVGDIIVASEVKWARFRRNPKMFPEHDHHADIGAWDPDSLTLVMVDGAPGWTAKGRLYPPGVSARADDVYARLQAGSMGVSVGFFVGTAEPRPGGRGQVLRGVDVFEASLVNLPACSACVVLEKGLRAPAPAPLTLDRATLERLVREEIIRSVDAAMPRFEAHLQRALRRHTGRVD